MTKMLRTPAAAFRCDFGLVAVDGRTFPLKSTRISARAVAGLAQTTLVQEYANPHEEPLEVLYTMPLPADGAVLGYTIRFGDRVIRGEIETREQAGESYRKALAERRTGGLLEQQRADTFFQRLGNLPAGAGARIEIETLHPLAFLSRTAEDAFAGWEYRFPTVVGVRYSGDPGRVPDAGVLEPARADEAGTPVGLTDDDRVEALAFANQVTSLTGGLVRATRRTSTGSPPAWTL